MLAATLAGAALVAAPVQAQTARKPSSFLSHDVQAEPDAAASLPALNNRADFDRMARVYDADTPLAIPHVLFVIDRHTLDAQGHARLDFVNSRRFDLHAAFVAAQRLSPPLSRSTLAAQYRDPNRRFFFGTLSWQSALRRWVWEAWDGDQLTPALITQTQQLVQNHFFAPVALKTNSSQHEGAAESAGIAYVSQMAIVREQPFWPLNIGQSHGRLRLITGSLDAVPDVRPDDILVLREVPQTLPPVAGVITTRPSTVLSHVNLLAKSWGIPNAYVRNAFDVLRAHSGQRVTLKVARSHYSVTPQTAEETQAAATPSASAPASAPIKGDATEATRPPVAPAVHWAAPTLDREDLTELSALRADDHRHCGRKAANLGNIAAAIASGRIATAAPVPDGFCIPYAHYAEFMRQPAVRERIAQAEHSEGFERDPARRRAALDALRRDLVALPASRYRRDAWLDAWHTQLPGAPVFVRSSANVEDLPGANAAGLYASVPNVNGDDSLIHAIKTVWASVFNFEAVEARRHAGIPFDRVAMGVLVQKAVAARSAGVLVTCNPLDPRHRNATYISAKRGLGIKVVEGQRVAEQVLYDRSTRAVQRLSASEEDSELQLDPRGGVREVPSSANRTVLTDPLVRRLAHTGQQLRNLFGGIDQDIEWAIDEQGRIVILQARPFACAAP